jgi:hypothetical protein
MGARTERKLCLEEDDGRIVLMEIRRWSHLESDTSGSSESESPSDDDDEDTVVQRYVEETSTLGHRMESRCVSADAQTQCLRVVSIQSVSLRCLVVAGSHPRSARLRKCLRDTGQNKTRRVQQMLRRTNTKGTQTHKAGAGRARSPGVLRHVSRPSPGPRSHRRPRVPRRHTPRRHGRDRALALPGHSLCRDPLASAPARSSLPPPARVSPRQKPILKVVAFASRSFTPPFTVFSGFRPT